jgi:hypothetical protein
MPRKIRDSRIKEGKINRNNAIREYFEKRYNEGLRYEIIEEEIISKWGLGASTINMIINESYGRYKQKNMKDDRQLSLFDEEEGDSVNSEK